MKKILIISYFFPPCNLTAAQRVNSWAKYLHEFNYYPIIITRKWEKHINSFDDCHYTTSKEKLVNKNKSYEVHYCPYKSNLRDKLLTKKKLTFLKKILTAYEIISQNIWIKTCPFNNLLKESENIINLNSEISCVIISGNPFIQFKFGYILNKKYNIPWIADYRDAWTTSTINNHSKNIITNILNFYHKSYEKKWIKSSSYITASSIPIGESIEELIKIPSTAIYNGFEPEDFIDFKQIKKNKRTFQIAYIGTLYDGQDISIFLEAFKKFINKKNPKTKILFPGIELVQSQKNRICSIMKGYESFYETSLRIPKSRIFEIEKESHLLLHVAWNAHKGIIASKIYEYIGSETKIIIVPGDGGSIDRIVNESNSGVIFNDIETTFDFLCNEYNNFINGKIKSNLKNDNYLTFSRRNQTYKLSEVINKITK